MKPWILVLGALLLLPACPAAPVTGPSSGGGGNGATAIDPNACGDLSNIDIGRKVVAFLDATVRLDRAITSTERAVRATCVDMGKILGMTRLQGPTNVVCAAVSEKLKADMKLGIAADAHANVNYEPAVCTVDADLAARAAAECQARAEAEIAVNCDGVCRGTCQGACDGTCNGQTGRAIECNSECAGTCGGTCSGRCDGSAQVDADASCKANAEVRANIEAQCTEPKFELAYDAQIVVDTAAIERASRAIAMGMPRMLAIHARMTGPVATAFESWKRASEEMALSAGAAAQALGARAVCVSVQLAAAAQALVNIRASFNITVEASISVSGAAGATLQ